MTDTCQTSSSGDSALPLEMIRLIAESLEDIETLKALRVASVSTCAAATSTFFERAFTRITCKPTATSLARLENICNTEWIAPYIQYIGFYDWQLVDFPESVKCPEENLYIPWPLHQVPIEDNNVLAAALASFEGLKWAKNTAVEVDLVIKSTSPTDIPTDGELPSAQNRLRWTRSSHFSSTVLEALAKSGFVPAVLNFPLDTPLAAWPWTGTTDDLKVLGASLRGVSIRQPILDYDRSRNDPYDGSLACYRYIKFNTSTSSAAGHILSNALQLQSLSINGFTMPVYFLPRRRIIRFIFPQKKLRVLQMDEMSLPLFTSLFESLIYGSPSTLETVRMSLQSTRTTQIHMLPRFVPNEWPHLRDATFRVGNMEYRWTHGCCWQQTDADSAW